MALLTFVLNCQLLPLLHSFSVHVDKDFLVPASDLPWGVEGLRLGVFAGPRSVRCLTVYFTRTDDINPEKSFCHESAFRVPIEIDKATLSISLLQGSRL